MNEILFIVSILINFIGIIIAYKVFKKTGLFVWVAISTIIANIEATKCIDMFGISVTLGNVVYSTVFLATDILSEIYGGQEARKAVKIGFFSMLIFTLLTQIDLLFIPNEQDIVNDSMHTIFSFMPRFCFASVVTYVVSNTLDTYLYDIIKNKLPEDKFLWVRNNGSTMISQLIDSILFTLIAFVGIYSWKVIINLTIVTYLVKLVVAVLDTPFIYIAKRIDTKSI
ncbi:MAG: queuosine precursor transporter [Clostridia bacterium]|nr:queuosine precursor transporter [Clostridia bacterium]